MYDYLVWTLFGAIHGRHSTGDTAQHFLANFDATPADASTQHLHWLSGEGGSVPSAAEDASLPARPVSYGAARSSPSHTPQEPSAFAFPFGFLPQVERETERGRERGVCGGVLFLPYASVYVIYIICLLCSKRIMYVILVMCI